MCFFCFVYVTAFVDFMPYLASHLTTWLFIDCVTGTLEAYEHGIPESEIETNRIAYNGGVYSPTEHKIYLAPYGQTQQPLWHYINVEDATVGSYAHGEVFIGPFDAFRGRYTASPYRKEQFDIDHGPCASGHADVLSCGILLYSE